MLLNVQKIKNFISKKKSQKEKCYTWQGSKAARHSEDSPQLFLDKVYKINKQKYSFPAIISSSQHLWNQNTLAIIPTEYEK